MKRSSITLVLMILSVTACREVGAPGAEAPPESANPVTISAPPGGVPVPELTATPTPVPTPALGIVGTVVAASQPQIVHSD